VGLQTRRQPHSPQIFIFHACGENRRLLANRYRYFQLKSPRGASSCSLLKSHALAFALQLQLILKVPCTLVLIARAKSALAMNLFVFNILAPIVLFERSFRHRFRNRSQYKAIDARIQGGVPTSGSGRSRISHLDAHECQSGARARSLARNMGQGPLNVSG
jgi:hypothetical protein